MFALSVLVTLSMVTLGGSASLAAQPATSRLSGIIRDTTDALVAGVVVQLQNQATGEQRTAASDANGRYVLPGLRPGRYELKASGSSLELEQPLVVQIELEQDSRLDLRVRPSGIQESVSIPAEVPILGTRDGSIGTIVTRQLIESLPLNGHSFHALLELTPGVVTVPGGFAVSGQRADANYFTVDGISANVGTTDGNSLASSGAGQAATTSVAGSFASMAALDSIQEIHIQTSSFAPEFGRAPGAQISIATRSGTNALHASVSYGTRSDALDARNWFVNYNGLAQPRLAQHAFGGSIGGPVVVGRLFYFGTYDALRLTQPRVLTGDAPGTSLRAQAPPAMAALLNTYPLPTGPVGANGLGKYAATSDDTIHSDATAARVDYALTAGSQLFGRYNDAPSKSTVSSIPSLNATKDRAQSLTIGLTSALRSSLLLDLRGNYSRSSATGSYSQRPSEGSESLPPSFFPSSIDLVRDTTSFGVMAGSTLSLGTRGHHTQDQVNFVGSLSYVLGSHAIKMGADYRRLTPGGEFADHEIQVIVSSLADLLASQATTVNVRRHRGTNGTYASLGTYAQDSWRASDRLTLTLGARWDLNPPPSFESGEAPFAAANVDSAASLSLAPEGTSLWSTQFNAIAPRIGVAYQLGESARTTLTGGIGLFYGMGTETSASLLNASIFPNESKLTSTRVSLPFTAEALVGLPIDQFSTNPPYLGTVYLVDPHLELPRSTQWNIRLERQLSTKQSASVAYVGSMDRQLLTQQVLIQPNVNFQSQVRLYKNGAESDYKSLQLSYRRRESAGLEIQASYTLAKTVDTVSATNQDLPAFDLGGPQKGPADFDVRHTVTGAVSWALPGVGNAFTKAVLLGTNVDMLFRARSGTPFTVYTGVDSLQLGSATLVRPNLVPGVEPWLMDPSVPTRMRLNRAAFTLPAAGTQGDMPRNALRGPGASQVDLSLRRSLSLGGQYRLQLSATAYNVFNIPSFANPNATMNSTLFGLTTRTLNEGLETGGGLNRLYQLGSSRSIEIGAKVAF